jgi:DNA-directed RNA polymerase specialized sigma24 family protein
LRSAKHQRRVDCRRCEAVVVEEVPWGDGKRQLTLDFDDIMQEACLKLWRAISDGREIHQFPSYLHRVAATVTIDAMRRVKARREEQMHFSLEQNGETEERPGEAEVGSDLTLQPATAAQRGKSSLEFIPRLFRKMPHVRHEQPSAVKKLFCPGQQRRELARGCCADSETVFCRERLGGLLKYYRRAA